MTPPDRVAVPHPTADVMCFIRPREFRWTPQPDITAYELALCQEILTGFEHPLKNRIGLGEAYDGLPPEAQRHLTEIHA